MADIIKELVSGVEGMPLEKAIHFIKSKVKYGMASRMTVSQLCCMLLLKETWEHWLNVYWHVVQKWIVEKGVELHPYIWQFFTGILK